MNQGGPKASALPGPQHDPAWKAQGFVAIVAAVPAAAAPLSLAHACVPADLLMPDVCLYNEPILGWTGQKTYISCD